MADGVLHQTPDPDTADAGGDGVAQRRNTEDIGALVAIAAASMLAWWGYRSWDFDDAYIVYRIVENLLDGDGWTYNPGERYNASTSVLNTVVITAMAVVTRSAPLAAHLLGTVAIFTSGAMTYRLLRPGGGAVAALAGALGLVVLMADNETWGLEINLFVALVLVFVRAEQRGRNTWPLLGVIFLARPDGILVFATKLAVETRRERRVPVRGPLLSLAVVAPWLLFSLAYFGQLLPATLSQKVWQGQSGFWGTGRVYLDGLTSHLGDLGPWLLPVAGLAAAGVIDCVRQRHPVLHLFTFVALQQAFYVMLDVPPYHWYFATLDVGLFLAAVFGVVRVIGVVGARVPGAERPLGFVVLVAIVIAGVQTYRPVLSDEFVDARDLAYRDVSDAIDGADVGEGALAAVEVGTLGYEQDRMIVDLLSLTSENPEFVTGRHNDEFFRRAPKVVVMFLPVGAMERALSFDPRFDELYGSGRQVGRMQFFVRTTDDEREIRATAAPAALEVLPFGGFASATQCWLDTSNFQPVPRGGRLTADGRGLSLVGWLIDPAAAQQGSARLALVDAGETTTYLVATTTIERADVAEATGNPANLTSGFSAHLTSSMLEPGVYAFAAWSESTAQLCPLDVTLAVEE